MMRQPVHEARIGLYSLLAALFRYPLRVESLEALKNLVVDADSPLASGLKSMQTRLKAGRTGNGSSDEAYALLDELNIEMTRLIEGPGIPAVPPFASYYLNNKQLMGTPAIEARRLYLEWQVIPEGEARLPDDHISLEMGFLAHLAGRTSEAQNSPGEIQALKTTLGFICKHLLPWLPQFCSSLEASSQDAFFTGLAQFTKAIVQEDEAWLTDLLREDALLHAV